VTDGSNTTRLAYLFAVVLSVVAGLGVAVQSRVNGELGLALGNGSLAALVSFGSGVLLLLLAMGVWRPGRVGLSQVRVALTQRTLPWWAILGGLAGGFFVLSQGLVGGIIGVALFSVAVVTGQTLGSVVIDSRGLFGASKMPLTAPRLVGSLIVLVGVVVAASVWSEGSLALGWPMLLPLLAGLGVGWQQAINGRVRLVAGSSLTATLLNFFFGTLALVIVFAVSLPFMTLPNVWPGAWWLYSGGIVGAGFIAIQAFTVNRIGVLALGVSLVAGQIIGALLLDWLFPVASSRISIWTIIGALLAVVGSALVTLTKKQRSES
jgi:bacterial/archaeal transporter family-2 protein